MEPDEEGRFGFNVQVRNLPVSFSSKCRLLWKGCDNRSKMSVIGELKQTTFISHGRKPEVIILHIRTVSGLFQTFKLIVSTSEKRLNNINMVV